MMATKVGSNPFVVVNRVEINILMIITHKV